MSETRDPQLKSSLPMRILAGILAVMLLAGMIFEFIFGHSWGNYFQAICQLIFAYLLIAYSLGDPIGSMMGNRNKKIAPKDSSK